jgi:uncharacterized membrane protein
MSKGAVRLVFALISLTLTASPILAQCGVERWSVKTGTDADIGTVNLGSSTATTIATLRALAKPGTLPANNRIQPTESTVFTLNATLTQYKLESDSDYHLILQDGSGNTMIAEIPSPNCVGNGSPLGPGIQNARSEFDAKFTATSSFQTANIPVAIKGVGFFDFLHGQTGVAPNGIELHAVLDVQFNPGSNPDFSIGASPTSLSVVQGTNGTSTITTTVSGGFNNAVALSSSGAPTGTTVAFSPASIAAPGSGSSTMTITVGASTAVGSYPITVTGTGGGKTHTTTVTLNVTASAVPDFAIAASPTSVTAVQGTNGFSTITTTVSGGFNSAVALSSSGAPAGTTVSFSPASIAAPGSGSSTMTIAVGASTAVGSYTITVTGTGGGKTHTATVSLNVTASGGGGGSELVTDGGFESATVTGNSAPGWTGTTNISGDSTIAFNGTYPHGGTNYGALGASNSETDTLTTTSMTIPANATAASLTFWTNIVTQETTTSTKYDFLYVNVISGTTTTKLTLSNLDNTSSSNTNGTYFKPAAIDLLSYKGQSIQVQFRVTTDSSLPTTFRVDDVSLQVTTGTADTTPPTTSVTAPANGATVSGTTTVTATASDNVGVTKMELYIDGVLTTSNMNATSLSYSWATTGVANGSHTLQSKAYDAAGNVGSSSTITVTVSNSGTQQLLGNPGFETGVATPWTATAGIIDNGTSEAAHSGSWKAWLDGYGAAHTDSLLQQVTIPSTATSATLTFWLHIDTAETTTTIQYDTLNVQIRNSSGTVLATLATYSNLNAATGYTQKSFDLTSYKGQTIQVYLVGVEDSQLQTSFVVDDFALNVQ